MTKMIISTSNLHQTNKIGNFVKEVYGLGPNKPNVTLFVVMISKKYLDLGWTIHTWMVKIRPVKIFWEVLGA